MFAYIEEAPKANVEQASDLTATVYVLASSLFLTQPGAERWHGTFAQRGVPNSLHKACAGYDVLRLITWDLGMSIAKLYSTVVLPRLCDLVMRRPAITKLRKQLLAHASGNVLEIGFGTGLNLPCYPESVRKITTVDPNPGMHRLALRRIKQTGRMVEHHQLSSERLPFADVEFDCVVSTFTLCSVENPQQAMAEVSRVLKRRGRMLFLEHGLSPDPGVQKWQHRLDWLERNLADGCRLTRNMPELVRTPGLTSVEVDEFYLEGAPRTHGYLYRGIATK